MEVEQFQMINNLLSDDIITAPPGIPTTVHGTSYPSPFPTVQLSSLASLDPVQVFLSQENKEFQISVFLQALPYLEKYQERNGEVTYHNILESLETLSPDLIGEDRKSYAYLIYETALIPRMINERPAMKLNRKFVRGNSKAYVKLLEEVMREHNEGLIGSLGLEKIERLVNIASVLFDADQLPPAPERNSNSFQQLSPMSKSPLPLAENLSLNDLSDTYSRTSESLGAALNTMNSTVDSNNNPTNEHVARFLAHIRKSGMDMIFPQPIYDQLLMVIFIAIKCAAPLAHRELMDMVMSVREKRMIRDIDAISKTKVRGVFSLLKNAQVLATSEGVGEGVRLFMGKGITSFKEFREKHDAFINKCIVQQHLFIPVNSRKELMWSTEKDEIAAKLEENSKLEKLLEDYFMNGSASLNDQTFTFREAIVIPQVMGRPPNYMSNKPHQNTQTQHMMNRHQQMHQQQRGSNGGYGNKYHHQQQQQQQAQRPPFPGYNNWDQETNRSLYRNNSAGSNNSNNSAPVDPSLSTYGLAAYAAKTNTNDFQEFDKPRPAFSYSSNPFAISNTPSLLPANPNGEGSASMMNNSKLYSSWNAYQAGTSNTTTNNNNNNMSFNYPNSSIGTDPRSATSLYMTEPSDSSNFPRDSSLTTLDRPSSADGFSF